MSEGNAHVCEDCKRLKVHCQCSDVNLKQVGGAHYKAAYQHWDFVTDIGLEYLEGCATKYVLRWRQKNGLQDLEKARHYVEKLISLRNEPTGWYNSAYFKEDLFQRMIASYPHPIPEQEVELLHGLSDWSTASDLAHCLLLLDNVIQEAKDITSAASR